MNKIAPKQAIKILESYRYYEYCDKNEENEQAFDLAINALETSCDNCPLSADGDLISQKSVLKNRIMEYSHEEVGYDKEVVDLEDVLEIIDKLELPTISADGDCISRKAVIQLTREMISAEEYGLMDLLDEVKKLPTIPQTDTKWDKLYMYLNDRRLAYSKSVEEHIEDYYKGIYDDLGQIMSVMEDMEKEEPKPIPQTDSETEYWKDLAKSYERTIVALQKGIAETQTDSVLYEIMAEIDKESIGYPPSADYYKAIKKAVRIIEEHISGKE